VREAAKGGADMIALPEMWATGFDFSQIAEYRQSLELRELEARLGTLAATLRVNVAAGSWLHFDDKDAASNRAHFFDSRGRHLAHYDKTHLFAPMEEDLFLTEGKGPRVFESEFGKTAMAICYDLRFADIFAAAAREGCKMMLVNAAWPAERVAAMVELAGLRARENACLVVVVNCVSPREPEAMSNDYVSPIFGGRSCVFGPKGQELFVAPQCAGGIYFIDIVGD